MATTSVTDLLAYFSDAALTRKPPATPEECRVAEEALGVSLPPSMRDFLLRHNGLLAIEYRIFGVTPGAHWESLAQEAEDWRFNLGEEQLIVIAHDDFGNAYALLPSRADAQGEYPVVFIDHETPDEMTFVASTYERFLWFALDDLQRRYTPDGEERARAKGSGWPFTNKKWMTGQDPALAALWKPAPPPKPAPAAKGEVTVTPHRSTRVPLPFFADAIAHLPDGRVLASAENRLYVIEPASGAVQDTIAADAAPSVHFRDWAVTADGRRVLAQVKTTWSGDETDDAGEPVEEYRIYDLATRAIIMAIPCIRYLTIDYGVVAARHAPLCALALRSLAEKRDLVRVYDLSSATLLQELDVAEFITLNAIALSPDGALLAVAAKEGSKRVVSVWERSTGERVHSFALKGDSAHLDFSPDGTLLAAGGGRGDKFGECVVFSLPTGKVLWKVQNLYRVLNQIAFSPDGRWLMTRHFETEDWQCHLRLWDARAGTVARAHILSRDEVVYGVNAVAFAPTGDALTVAGQSWDNKDDTYMLTRIPLSG